MGIDVHLVPHPHPHLPLHFPFLRVFPPCEAIPVPLSARALLLDEVVGVGMGLDVVAHLRLPPSHRVAEVPSPGVVVVVVVVEFHLLHILLSPP